MVAVRAEEGSATRLGRWLGRAVRVAVALMLLGGLLGSALTAARREPLTRLSDDIAAGRVSEVAFTEGTGLEPLHLRRGGDPDPTVRWKVTGSGWRSASLADVTDLLGPGSTGADGTDGSADPVSGEQVAREKAQAAGIPVTTTTPQVPRLLISLSTLAAFVLVLVLIGAPQPRRATKWAWFWLMLVPGGLTQLLWLAVDAPWSERANRLPEPRPHRQQPGDTRLTGGRSFLLSGVLAIAISWVGWRIGGWLAG